MANKRKLSDEDIQVILQQVSSGRSQSEIAKEHKVEPYVIYSLVKKHRGNGTMPKAINGLPDTAPPDKALKKQLEFYKARCIKLESALVESTLREIEAKGLNFL